MQGREEFENLLKEKYGPRAHGGQKESRNAFFSKKGSKMMALLGNIRH